VQAILKSAISKDRIEGRVVYGVRLAEKGKLARFTGEDGKPREIDITEALISELAKLANGKTIPAHLSHDYMGADKDAIHARCGAHKNVRVDESGNLVSDFHAMPGDAGDEVLWFAENDPDNAMFSAVFGYNDLGNRKAFPFNFKAADVVAQGAATTAMFSQTKPDTDMTKEEIQALITESITAALAAHKPAGVITEAQADERITAALAKYNPALTKEQEDALLVKAEAKFASHVGTVSKSLGLSLSADGKVDDHAFVAKVKSYEATGQPRGKAILRAAQDDPANYNDYRAKVEIGALKALN
jgi:hypothetical protein